MAFRISGVSASSTQIAKRGFGGFGIVGRGRGISHPFDTDARAAPSIPASDGQAFEPGSG
jgi:hypothetical protein